MLSQEDNLKFNRLVQLLSDAFYKYKKVDIESSRRLVAISSGKMTGTDIERTKAVMKLVHDASPYFAIDGFSQDVALLALIAYSITMNDEVLDLFDNKGGFQRDLLACGEKVKKVSHSYFNHAAAVSVNYADCVLKRRSKQVEGQFAKLVEALWKESRIHMGASYFGSKVSDSVSAITAWLAGLGVNVQSNNPGCVIYSYYKITQIYSRLRKEKRRGRYYNIFAAACFFASLGFLLASFIYHVSLSTAVLTLSLLIGLMPLSICFLSHYHSWMTEVSIFQREYDSVASLARSVRNVEISQEVCNLSCSVVEVDSLKSDNGGRYVSSQC